MSFDFYIKKYKYYRTWYEELTIKERDGEIGKWLYKNCVIYHHLIQDCEKGTPNVNGPTNNYPDAWN